jgi:hypothetical protein
MPSITGLSTSGCKQLDILLGLVNNRIFSVLMGVVMLQKIHHTHWRRQTLRSVTRVRPILGFPELQASVIRTKSYHKDLGAILDAENRFGLMEEVCGNSGFYLHFATVINCGAPVTLMKGRVGHRLMIPASINDVCVVLRAREEMDPTISLP